MAKLLIADDSQKMRAALKNLLASQDGWVVCGEASDGWEAVRMAEELKPDAIILDMAMPILDGLHAAAEIVGKRPEVPVLLYTLHKSPEIELEAMKAGARGVVSKLDDPAILVDQVKELLREKAQVLPAVVQGSTVETTGTTAGDIAQTVAAAETGNEGAGMAAAAAASGQAVSDAVSQPAGEPSGEAAASEGPAEPAN